MASNDVHGASHGGVYSETPKGRKYTCDLRSDTVTVPCEGMRKAMTAAEVGDDVMVEDPTVIELERHVADLCGKEAGLFVASGTMSNQLAMRCHLNAMESVLLDTRSHIFVYECGGVSAHSQAQMIPVSPLPGEHYLTAEALEPAIVTENVHHATTTLISLENTLWGSVMPLKVMQEISAMAKRHGLKTHLDGARLWNACVATNTPIREYAACVDTVSLCLSKTLGAPVGSVLVGPQSVIDRARKFRKMFGGGWRQAGILAAAGMYAITHNWGPTMAEVHANAQFLGDELRKMGFTVNKSFKGAVESNMVWVENEEPFKETGVTMAKIADEAGKHGIAMWADTKGAVGGSARLVLHHQVPKPEVIRFVSIVRATLAAAKKM